MRNPPVNWYEGMFLRPHHFQLTDRFWGEFVGESHNLLTPYGYGVDRQHISTEALKNGIFEYGNLVLRWIDGTVLTQDESEVTRIELKERLSDAFENSDSVMVYCAVPKAVDGQINVASEPGGLERFVRFSRPTPDESVGGNHQDIRFKKLNHRILFSNENTEGYDLLPLTRLIQSQSGEAGYQIDPDYFPPCLQIDGWPELRAIVRKIYDMIGERIQLLGDVIEQQRISLSSQSGRNLDKSHLEKLLLLNALNEAYAELSCLVFADRIHPLPMYACLCRFVGKFSLFGPRPQVQKIPRYDHDDLATIYKWALSAIHDLIYTVKQDPYEQRYFIGNSRGLAVQLKPEWFTAEWEWYLGVDAIETSRDECLRLLNQEIDWKLGSEDKVEEYMIQRRPGVKLRLIPQVPAALPTQDNWVFLQIRKENEAWSQVQANQTLAMRVRTDQIANLDGLVGNRRLALNISGSVYSMEFAVFAVRKRV